MISGALTHDIWMLGLAKTHELKCDPDMLVGLGHIWAISPSWQRWEDPALKGCLKLSLPSSLSVSFKIIFYTGRMQQWFNVQQSWLLALINTITENTGRDGWWVCSCISLNKAQISVCIVLGLLVLNVVQRLRLEEEMHGGWRRAGVKEPI